MMMYGPATRLVTVVFALSAIAVTASGADDDFQSAVAGVGEAIRQLKSKGVNFQNEVVESSYDVRGGNEVLTAVKKYTRASKPDGFYSAVATTEFSEMPLDARQPRARVVCFNPKYHFQLNHFADRGWLVDKVVLSNTPSETAEQKADREQVTHLPPALSHYTNSVGIQLDVLFAHAGYNLVSFLASPDNPGCKRVTYTVTGENIVRGMKDKATVGGWLDVDPSKGWSITEFDETTDIAAIHKVTHGKFQTRELGNCYFVTLDDKRHRGSMGGQPVSNTRVVSTHTPALADPTDISAFTLTSYGLPEPEGVTWERPTRPYIWLIIAAVACAGGALAARYLARRAFRG